MLLGVGLALITSGWWVRISGPVSLVVFLGVGLALIIWAWWVRIPDPPGKKATEIGLSLVGAGAAALVFGVILVGVCSWMSVNIGGQPLQP